MSESFLQGEEGHRLLGVIELAGYGGPSPMTRDGTTCIPLWYTGLFAECRDYRVIDDALSQRPTTIDKE
jgi:hypothetical protein